VYVEHIIRNNTLKPKVFDSICPLYVVLVYVLLMLCLLNDLWTEPFFYINDMTISH